MHIAKTKKLTSSRRQYVFVEKTCTGQCGDCWSVVVFLSTRCLCRMLALNFYTAVFIYLFALVVKTAQSQCTKVPIQFTNISLFRHLDQKETKVIRNKEPPKTCIWRCAPHVTRLHICLLLPQMTPPHFTMRISQSTLYCPQINCYRYLTVIPWTLNSL